MDTLRSIMTSQPACCQPDTPLPQVAQMMATSDCGEIPVVDAHARVVGVVTDRDIALRAVAAGRDAGACCAADIMSQPAITLPESAELSQVLDLMEQRKFRRVVLVNDRDQLAGIVAQADIARCASAPATAGMVREVSEPRC